MKITEFGGDQITTTVVNAMRETSNVLQIAEFYPIVGNAAYSRKSASATGGKFRNVNDNYEDNKVDPSFANPTLKIMGDKVQVDRAHERRGSDIASVRAAELINFAKNFGKQFQNYFINGDSSADAKQFNGLKKIIPAGQLITPAQNGIIVTLGNDNTAKKAQQALLEQIDILIQLIDGGAQALMMDGHLISRLTRLAEGQVVWGKDEFGNPLAHYAGITILPAGYDKSGNPIIPLTEDCGTSTNCTSIYAFKFGEESDLSFATNVGVEVKDNGLVGNLYEHSVEIDLDQVLLNQKSVARLEGIIIG